MKKSDPQVLILGADYASGNMGVDALLSGTIAAALQANPDLRIRLLTYATADACQPCEGLGEPVRMRFSWKPQLPNNVMRLLGVAVLARAVGRWRGWRGWLMARHPELRVIERARVCVALAGGDSFSDIYGWRRFFAICLPQLLVLVLGRPLVLLPQTLGPFRACWARALARVILRHAAQVYSRDLEGVELGRRMLGAGAAPEFSSDMGFALQGRAPAQLPGWLDGARGRLVGVNVSGLLYQNGSAGGAFGLACSYQDVLDELVLWFSNHHEMDVMLVSHVTGRWESDAAACADMFERLGGRCGGRLRLADPCFNHREIKHLIGQCEFFIGARMHACIAALSQGVPAVGMAYSGKFAGVFESVAAGELVVDLRGHTTDEVVAQVQDAYVRRAEYAQRLAAPVAAARASALGIFSKISSRLAKPLSSSARARRTV